MQDSKSLQGHTAIVTGASSGIGRATAELLAQAGAHVYLAGRTTAALEELNSYIVKEGGQSSVVTIDLRDTRPFPSGLCGAATRLISWRLASSLRRSRAMRKSAYSANWQMA